MPALAPYAANMAQLYAGTTSRAVHLYLQLVSVIRHHALTGHVVFVQTARQPLLRLR